MIGVERTPEARLARLYTHARGTAWLYLGYSRGTAYEALRPHQRYGLDGFTPHLRLNET